MRQVVQSPSAPKAIGPYSTAIIANGFVFAAGQTPIDPKTQTLIDGDVSDQTEQCLQNITAVLASAGSRLENVVRCVVYLTSMDDFEAMNAAYARYFPTDPPARTTIAVAGLPKNARVEIEVTALLQTA